MMKKRGLGRNLEALLASTHSLQKEEVSSVTSATTNIRELQKMPVEHLCRGRYQPRHEINPDSLIELAESIKTQGIIQPIVVRAVSDRMYEIIAGERRWRAAQLAGLSEVPVIVRDVPDEAAIAMALIENIQREDLNALEEARALQRLMSEFQMIQQEVADAVGKSRAAIANTLRLLNLNEEVKILLERDEINAGHAKVLLALEGFKQTEAAKTVVEKGLSVRETESLVRRLLTDKPSAKQPAAIDVNIRSLQNSLSDKLGARVIFSHQANGKGKVMIAYNSLDELDGILRHIN
ncbi:MAG: chromosome partitioning protein ParB [Gammaproteobacteria bacterium GWF2_41_13]|nr:MAG: chromosome partitioning protein ParB [Gammaproteobacteria bacterium GWF2_41_13]